MSLTIAVISDLFKAGVTEDGRDFEAERYYVMAEANDGRRWVYGLSFDSTRQEFDDEDGFPFFPDNREEAHAKAENIAVEFRRFLHAGGELDLDLWQETDPRYGSDEYQINEKAGVYKERERRAEY